MQLVADALSPLPLTYVPPTHSTRMSLSKSVLGAFTEAKALLSRYEEMRVIHAFCTTFDAEEYKQGERDVLQFRRDMALLRLVSLRMQGCGGGVGLVRAIV